MKLTQILSIRSRIIPVFLITLCLLSFAAVTLHHEQITFLQGKQIVSGIVHNREGTPVKDSKILVFSGNENYPGNPLFISFTKPDGTFEFNASKNQSYVLEVHGDLGAGRVFVSAHNATEKLKIIYPVNEKIIILHTNDQHFDINLHNEMIETIDKIRNENPDVFLMDAGDVFVRHPARWTVNGKLMKDQGWYGKRSREMIDSMNELMYDVMTLGNHELVYIEPYTRLALENAKFPLLAANIDKPAKGLPPLDDYVIFHTTTWRKLAVLGLTGGQYIPETVIKFLSLRNSSDLFIALTHIGFKNDYALAEKFPEFDVIVGGHSHHLLEEAVMVNNVLVAQAGGCPHFVSDDHPVYLGIIMLNLENGVLREKSGKVIQITKL